MKVFIVGANRTETAARAVEAAGELARLAGARLVVLTAYEEDRDAVDVVGETFVIGGAEDSATFARRTAEQLRDALGIDAIGEAAKGKPAEVILEAAARHHADLIVVGNVRMQGPGRLLGSVANHVAHHAPCDVYIVKTT